jgi:hypothetical protein
MGRGVGRQEEGKIDIGYNSMREWHTILTKK